MKRRFISFKLANVGALVLLLATLVPILLHAHEFAPSNLMSTALILSIVSVFSLAIGSRYHMQTKAAEQSNNLKQDKNDENLPIERSLLSHFTSRPCDQEQWLRNQLFLLSNELKQLPPLVHCNTTQKLHYQNLTEQRLDVLKQLEDLHKTKVLKRQIELGFSEKQE